jgi:hypothetical protein
MTTPDPFTCACDVDSPVCACLPLWVGQATDEQPQDDE